MAFVTPCISTYVQKSESHYKCSYGVHKFKPSHQKRFHISLCFVIVLSFKCETFSGNWV